MSTDCSVQPRNRGQWANKREFILAVAGQIIGLSNFWRFPYLCFKNGGGVFLIPYVVFLFTVGIPLFFAEISLGQFSREGGITCWNNICLLAKGLGYGSQVVLSYTLMHYIVIMGWAFLYLFLSFNTELLWGSCNNTWNTDDCFDGQNLSAVFYNFSNATSPVKEFWQKRILGLSGGIEEVGTIRWDLAGCVLLSWIICYFCAWKGVKCSGKIVYFTATFPFVMLIALLIRGLTLPGALDGIKFYLYPDPARLIDIQVWMDAGSQILGSYSVSIGSLQVVGSYNKYTNNCYKDAFFLCLLNSFTSFFAGFAVFSVLGFMTNEMEVDISVVADSGPGLAFITYPSAIALMPFPQLWAAFFFIMIILLGIDSQFVFLESLVTSISDTFSIFRTGCRRKLLMLAICVVFYLIGLLMVTNGGLYIFLLFDYYMSNGMPLMFFAIIESVCIGWVYGADGYYDKIEDMIGYYPSPYMKYCWKIFTPILCTCILLLSLINFTPLKYNTYQYPWWAYALGISFALISVVLVPLWAFYILAVTPGTLRQRLKVLLSPEKKSHASPNVGPALETSPELVELHVLKVNESSGKIKMSIQRCDD